ncbi:HAD family hydrolase [Microbacterium sp. STN6]|uniref:HAD family hydrolase n=1 Tax=Microbacterium sp. STN6 TaxID=2995588 RepID=UPI002260BB48|nr:HAD family hydrolase [Microbacterium sp. STN6]MCX7523134.1 HAD family hydrolase [Microbacterium sp. STN6]
MPRPPAAVLFDLYDTLVSVPADARLQHQRQLASRLRLPVERFLALWQESSPASNLGTLGSTADRVRWVMERGARDAERGLSRRTRVVEHALSSRTPTFAEGRSGREGELALAGEPGESGGAEGALAAELADLEHGFLAQATRPVDGVPSLLRELRERGIRTWILSNCSPSVVHTLAAARIEHLVDGMTLSCDVGLAKPDPAIYRHALDQLGVDPHDAAYVADGVGGELDAARRLGLRAIRVTWSNPCGAAPTGTPVAGSAQELRELLGL